LRKYKYNNRFCKKKTKKIARYQEKIVFYGNFGLKNALDREFFAIFVPSFNKITTT